MKFQNHHPAIAVPAATASGSEQRAAAISQAHQEIDAATKAFAEQTGIACPEGCGRCCHSPEVEATVADVLPLAMEIVRRGEAEATLMRLAERADDLRCALFQPDAEDGNRGRCTMYAWRPSICRLFGFAGRRDADGQPQYSACRVHSQVMPEVVAAAKQAVAERRVALPILSDLAGRVAAAAPDGLSRPLPINVALRRAINAAALQAWLEAAQGHDDDHDGSTPSPNVPPRQAA